jgi:hypothetical protein
MEKVKRPTITLTFPIALSIIGLVLIPILVLLPKIENFQSYSNQSIIGILFTAVCFLGLAAALKPAKCRSIFEKTQNPLPQTNKVYSVQIKGHHPDCQNYAGNRIKIRKRVFCAACTGLIVGAIIALFGTIFYFFAGLNLEPGGLWLLALGEIGVSLGLTQIWSAGFVKVLLNLVFVVGSFATLVAVDTIARSFFVDLYVLGLILFLLWFRILLSEWNNRQICSKCQLCFH